MEHSTPVTPQVEVQTGAKSDVQVLPSEAIEAPPSLYHLLEGKTFLSTELGIEDDLMSNVVNEFVVHKVKSSGLKDTKEGYRQALRDLINESGLTVKHEGKAIIEAVYNRFENKDMNTLDYIEFLNILLKREHSSARI